MIIKNILFNGGMNMIYEEKTENIGEKLKEREIKRLTSVMTT
jgi:hypothetical protein